METVVDRHIVVDEATSHGKPHLAGRRIRVQDIVVWHERLGLSVDRICAEYNLSLAEVYAALAYYFDYKDAIDQDIAQDESFVKAFKERNPSLLQERLKDLRGG